MVHFRHGRQTEEGGVMLIDIRNLYKIYNEGQPSEVRAINGVNLTVDRGEFVTIIGASGCGKTTLMNIVGCMDFATRGTYLLDGIDVASLPDEKLAPIRSKKVSFIFQSFNLLPRLTAYENVALPLMYQGIPASERKDIVMEALDKVSMADRANHKPAELSGGQQQRVTIARSIATKPPILLADEPTGALDSKNGRELLDILNTINEDGATILLVTHDYEVANSAKRIIYLSDGELIFDGANIEIERSLFGLQ